MEEFLYFDEAGIESLAAQLKDGALKSYTRDLESETKDAGSIKPKLSLGGLLRVIGVASFDLESEASTEHRRRELRGANFEVTREDRYAAIVAALTEGKKLYRGIDAARTASKLSGGSVYCDISGSFVPRDFDIDNETWLNVANKSEFLALALKSDRSFTMGMSLKKMSINGRINPMSHLYISVRSRGAFDLKVFGRIDVSSYLKPFVVAYL